MRQELTLVTGVSGFVGAAVARALAASGRRLRGFVRPTSPCANLAEFPGELVEGDLRDPSSVARAMAGVGEVLHVAADYRIWARDPAEIIHNNRMTTQNVIDAAVAAGIARMVYTSSVATLLPDPTGASDESRIARQDQVVGAYKHSKVLAEELVRHAIKERGLPAVIVHPSTPIGPGDVKPTPTGRIIVEAANGRMPAFVDSGLNLVHVDDVAQGHLLALERGVPGESYILGGQDVTLAQMLASVARTVGRHPPTVRIPRSPLVPLAWANERFAALFGYDPFLTLDGLRMSKHRMFYSSAKAERDLGYSARSHEIAIADAVGWFRRVGMVR